jgi:hypothetical protein
MAILVKPIYAPVCHKLLEVSHGHIGMDWNTKELRDTS